MTNTQTIIPQLSKYQFGLLCSTALAPVPIFIIPKPLPDDTASKRYKLQARNNEVKSLVAMGLMEDASEEFEEQISEQYADTGRKFKAYGMTEIGYTMFSDCDNRTVN